MNYKKVPYFLGKISLSLDTVETTVLNKNLAGVLKTKLCKLTFNIRNIHKYLEIVRV